MKAAVRAHPRTMTPGPAFVLLYNVLIITAFKRVCVSSSPLSLSLSSLSLTHTHAHTCTNTHTIAHTTHTDRWSEMRVRNRVRKTNTVSYSLFIFTKIV